MDSEDPATSSLMDRMWRAAKLDPELYEEVEADKSSLGQATTVVILSALAAGLGNFHYGGLQTLFLGTVGALLGWYVWAFLTYFIGTRLLPTAETEADHRELLRTTGFSAAPGLIRAFGIIPGLADTVFAIAGIWMLIAMVISVRQALDYTSTWRALAVCLVGWLAQGVVLFLIVSAFALPEEP